MFFLASNKGRMISLYPQERLQDCVKSRSGWGHLKWHQSGPDKLVSIWCLGQRLGFQSAGFIEWREKKNITSWYKWVSLECLSVFTTCTVFVQYFHSLQDHYIRKLHSVWYWLTEQKGKIFMYKTTWSYFPRVRNLPYRQQYLQADFLILLRMHFGCL